VTPDGRINHFAGSPSGVSGFVGDLGAPGLARLSRPSGLAVSGNFLYIADTGNSRIRRVDLENNNITTYAGDGTTGANGDGGVATSANLNNPVGLAFDAAGNLYIADRANHRIRRVDAITKNITTVAGTGLPGAAGDDAAATAAQLNSPNDVAVDAAGNVYIADQGNHRIRRIMTNGVIKSVAGTGQFGFGADNGPALLAPLNAPAAIEVDPQGNLFIADNGNLRVRRLTASTGTSNRNPVITSTLSDQTLVVGQTLELPLSATDADSDNVTFTLSNAPDFTTITNANPAQRSATLRLAPTQTGTFNGVLVQAGDGKGGTATSTSFKITVNEATGANRPPTANANTLAATAEATSTNGATINLVGQGSDPDGDALTFTWFNGASSIAAGATASTTLALGTHSLKLVVSDGRGGMAMTAVQIVVVRDTTAPVISNLPANVTISATSTSGAAVTFSLPIANDAVDGAIAVTASRASGSTFPLGTTTVSFTARDTRNNEATASFTVTVTSGGSSGGSTPASYTITTFAGTGEFGFAGDGGAALSANFRNLVSLSRDKDGNLLLADQLARVIRRITPDGASIRTVAGNGQSGNNGDNSYGIYASFGAVAGEAADGLGNLYISDSAFHRVRRITADGKITNFVGSSAGQSGATGDQGMAASARLNRPTALAVDAQNNLYILDGGNSRVRRVDVTTNIITTYAGAGINGYGGDGGSATGANFSYPSGMAFDAQGNLFIADRSNHRIRRVDAATQTVTTVAGNGTLGFSGDGGQAVNASLNLPTDVAVDAAGNLYIVDQGNHRIRRVRASDRVIETIAGDGIQSFGGDGGPAPQARFNAPTAINVAVDGSVFVADNGNLRIRKLAPVGNTPPPTNRNPVITSALGNQSLTVNQTVNLSLAATDENGDAVTFTLLNAPSFATITNANPAQRTATLRLAPTQAGTFNNVQVRATDSKNGATTSAAFNLTVTESGSGGGNQAPVIQALANQTVTRGQAIDVEVRA
ncbi:MAG: HYR domain-containing protein, partial [Acidobacteria bacterium]|nr:HYR domain-containing protein [Acidobacteriota bacterium]